MSVQAQEKIETDLPDQTETPFTVPLLYFQAEFGVGGENSNDRSFNLIHPTALLKYGISRRVEFRLQPTVRTEFLDLIPATKSSTLLDPVQVGTKVSLWDEKKALPKTSVIVHVGLPFLASKATRPEKLPYSVVLTMQNTLTKKIGLGYNIGAEHDGNELSWIYTFSPGINISERWYTYIEMFGSFSKGTLRENAFDGGVAYNINQDVKVDLSAGFGLTPATFKNYFALGFSFRVPVKK